MRSAGPLLALALISTLPCRGGTAQGTGTGGQIPPGPFATSGIFTSDAVIGGSGIVAGGNAITVNLLGLQHDFAGELIITLSYLDSQGNTVQSVDLVNRLGQSASAPYGTAADFGDGTGAGDNYLFNSDYPGNLWSAANCSDAPACTTPLGDLDPVPGVTNDAVNGGQYSTTTAGGAKTNLSYAFAGLDVSKGTWRLTINDTAAPNSGSLVGWQIVITTVAAAQTAVAFAGTPQSTQTGMAFPSALQAQVTDGSGNGLNGITVTFSAPASGASAAFNGVASAQAVTNSSGIATSPVPVANGTAGAYTVSASVTGLASATFNLTNTAAAITASAVFQKIDTSTRGNWKGVYGSDGSQVANDSTNLPSYAALALTGALTYTWASNTSDPRALLTYASTTNRIASTYYNLPGFKLDLNLSGGQSHQVALYLLDWDNGGRSQTITISDATTNVVLDTRTLAAFQGGDYVVYNISGHVVFQVTQLTGQNAVISGLFFDTQGSTGPAPPTVSISTPIIGQTVSGTVTLSATASSSVGIASLQFQLDGSNLGASITAGPPYTYSWNSAGVTNGAHTLAAIATDSLSQRSSTSVTFTVNNGAAPTASASFVKADAVTRGSWKGVYGSDGSVIANDSSQPAGYASLSFGSAALYTWSVSTTDVRALQKYESSTDRIASTYYNLPGFTLDLNLSGGSHQVALYLLDWDFGGRAETITITDAATHAVLDTRTAASFQNGSYLVWNITGHVSVQVTQVAGQNAVVAGIFFDTPGGPSSQPPVAAISTPVANQTVSGTVTLAATASSSAGIASLQFVLDDANLGAAIASSPYTYQWDSTTVSNGSHTLQAIATDKASQQATASVTFGVNNTSNNGAATVQFLKKDVTTAGSWKTVYGEDGEIIASDSNSPPSYATAVFSGAAQFLWTLTGDPRALQQATGSNRSASTFYASPSFTLDLNLTGPAAHQVALYFLDWDGAGRAETLTIIDAVTNRVLDTRPISGFQQGAYLVWNVTGHIVIQFTQTAGSNAVVSGVFFAPAS